MYLLAAIYADGADRRRIAREQGSMDMKEFFTDLKIRLEGSFTLTNLLERAIAGAWQIRVQFILF
jgi:hypothetical protein